MFFYEGRRGFWLQAERISSNNVEYWCVINKQREKERKRERSTPAATSRVVCRERKQKGEREKERERERERGWQCRVDAERKGVNTKALETENSLLQQEEKQKTKKAKKIS